MRNLICLLFLGLVIFAVAGWMLDWYTVGDVRSKEGQHRVSIDIDANKLRQDLQKGGAKLSDTVQRIREAHAEKEKTTEEQLNPMRSAPDGQAKIEK